MSEIAATTTGRKRGRKPVEVAPTAGAEASEIGAEAEAAAASAEATEGPAEAVDSGRLEIAPPIASDELLGGIEALLFSVDKPLGWARVAAAVGLIDADTASEAAANDDDGGAEAGAQCERIVGTECRPTKGKDKGAKRAAGPSAIIREAVAKLNTVYQQSGRAFRIEQVAGGYRVMTLAKHAAVLERFHGGRERSALSKAALETLAIIAYKQPLTRAGLEAIRGVACGEILRALLERRLITIVGRAEELGRPILYGTSKRFLETFGLGSVKDLPTIEELRMRA